MDGLNPMIDAATMFARSPSMRRIPGVTGVPYLA